MWRPLIILACSVSVLLASRAALACDYSAVESYEVASDPADTTPPRAPSVTYSIKRGRAPEREGCSQHASSCDDTGRLRLFLNEDDDDAEADLGYMVEVVSGDARLVYRPGEPLEAPDGELTFVWSDGEGTDDLSVVLDVFSVDRAGNVSEQATRVVVRSDGADGCSAVNHAGAGWCWFLALFAALRRKRASSGPS